MEHLRRFVAFNFACALMVAAAVFTALIVEGLQDTTPTGQKVNRALFGASILILFEALLAYLYFFKRAELSGLVRVFAAVLGGIGLLHSLLVPLIVHELYGYPFLSWQSALMWYVYAAHLAYALIGGPARRKRRAMKATKATKATKGAVSDSAA